MAPTTRKNKIRVLLLDPAPISALDIFRAADFEIEERFEQLSEAELVRAVGEVHIICLSKRQNDFLSEEVLRSAHRLLAIGCFNEKATQVNLKTATSMGVPVFHSPYGHSHSVAELVISNIITLARQMGDRSLEIHRHEWNKKSAGCTEIRGKKLGIIGYGHIGSQLSILGEAMGMEVIWYDQLSLMPIGRSQSKATMEEVLKEADFVSLHVTKSSENDNLITKDKIKLMKKGSYFINVSHGKAVDLEALADAVRSKQLAGVAIDAWPQEPQEGKLFETPFKGLSNVIMTPGIANITVESWDRVGARVGNNIVRYITEASTTGAANLPNIDTWAIKKDSRRIMNIHLNIRGVLKEIDFILSEFNVCKQVLDTDSTVGVLIADVESNELTSEIVQELALLSSSIRTRII